MGKVELVSAQEFKGKDHFDRLMKELKPLLDDITPGFSQQFQFDHIGSTSIPSILAKPVVDIMVQYQYLADLPLLSKALSNTNYGFRPFRHMTTKYWSFFTSPDMTLSKSFADFHLHIHPQNDPEAIRHLRFAEYLRSNEEDAKAYEQMKMKGRELHPDDTMKYASYKTDFVKAMDIKIRGVQDIQDSLTPGLKTKISPNKCIMPIDKAEASTQKLQEAFEMNLYYYLNFAARFIPDYFIYRGPEFALNDSGIDNENFNNVFDIDLEFMASDFAILPKNFLNERFKGREQHLSFWIPDWVYTKDFCEQYQYINLKWRESHCTMAISLQEKELTVPSNGLTDLNIVKATTQKQFDDFASVWPLDPEVYNIPHQDEDLIEYYVGYVDGKAVTTGALVLYGGVAGLRAIATLPEYQKKNYGALMQNYCLRRTRDTGYHFAVLETSSSEQSLYLKQGFFTIGTLHKWGIY